MTEKSDNGYAPLAEAVGAVHTPANPRPLTELKTFECRFPLNSVPRSRVGELIFCGDPVRDAKVSWCRYHCGIVFAPAYAARSPRRAPIFLPVDPVDKTPEAPREPEVRELA